MNMSNKQKHETMRIREIDSRIKEIMKELYYCDLGIRTGKRKLKKEFKELSDERLILKMKEAGFTNLDLNQPI